MDIYVRAAKEKIRFEYKGLLTVEDLWDLSVQELDNIYRELSSKKKAKTEDSLLETRSEEDVLLNCRINIVKQIVEMKLQETEHTKELAERKLKKEKIMEIIANKQDKTLEDKSEKQLQKMLNEL